MRRWGTLSVLVAVASCSSQQTTLDECLVAWWRAPQNAGCVCPTPAPPECQATDCALIYIDHFDGKGTALSGGVLYSKQLGTMSNSIPMSSRTYVVANGSIQYGGTTPATAATCGGDQLTLSGQGFVHAWPGLSAALDAATASGSEWTSWHVAPQ